VLHTSHQCCRQAASQVSHTATDGGATTSIGYPLLDAKHLLCMGPMVWNSLRTTSAHSRTMSPLDGPENLAFFPAHWRLVIIVLYKLTFTIPWCKGYIMLWPSVCWVTFAVSRCQLCNDWHWAVCPVECGQHNEIDLAVCLKCCWLLTVKNHVLIHGNSLTLTVTLLWTSDWSVTHCHLTSWHCCYLGPMCTDAEHLSTCTWASFLVLLFQFYICSMALVLHFLCIPVSSHMILLRTSNFIAPNSLADNVLMSTKKLLAHSAPVLQWHYSILWYCCSAVLRERKENEV